MSNSEFRIAALAQSELFVVSRPTLELFSDFASETRSGMRPAAGSAIVQEIGIRMRCGDEIMSVIKMPVGVAIVHQYYPGFIDLPLNSQFIIDSPSLSGSVQILSHERPLVVTDFSNTLVQRNTDDGRHPTDISHPINGIDEDHVSADAQGFEGRAGPAIAIEKAIRGRVFYQDVYTSMHFCAEFDDPERAENVGLRMHRPLLERFIGTYRYLNPDVRLAITSDMPEATTPLRIGHYIYTPAERRLPFDERIVHAQPDQLRLSIVRLGRGGRALQDHVGNIGDIEGRAVQLGGHLGSGFVLPDNLLAIERLADLAFTGRQLRSAVVEAMSIVEVAILDAKARFQSRIQSRRKTLKPADMSWKFLIESVLPALLSLFDGEKGPIIQRGKRILTVRHAVVHENYTPTPDETNEILSFTRSIVTILELPDQFKGNWKRRSDQKRDLW